MVRRDPSHNDQLISRLQKEKVEQTLPYSSIRTHLSITLGALGVLAVQNIPLSSPHYFLEKAVPNGPLAGNITAPLLILTGLFVLVAG